MEETFFFHSDHLGSTSYITDDKGNITQYDTYLPYGELLVDVHSSCEEMPYKFNEKEFDDEKGKKYSRLINGGANINRKRNENFIGNFIFYHNPWIHIM